MDKGSEPLEQWLLLWRLLEQSHTAFLKLWRHLETPSAALQADPQCWAQAGLSARWLKALEQWRAGNDLLVRRDVEEAQRLVARHDLTVLTLADSAYPPLLLEIADPPPLLFCQGEAGHLAWPQVAMVGSRRPSQNGLTTARDFAADLARQGLGITSGLAMGIDAAAHQAALQAEGITVAVLGSGLCDLYPRQHAALAEAIVAHDGILVSEFLPQTPPQQYHFPRRNRVISGLSLGVLVVEAAVQSGTLITARLALEQNREVWAIPGSIHNPQVKGCHALIREGARLVDEPVQLLEDIGPRLAQAAAGSGHPQALPPMEMELDDRARQVLTVLGWQVQSFDALVDQSGYDAATMAGLLLELELAGCIATVAGGYEQLAPSR
ncbi:MAG: DNA-processing protein DprA [Fluviicoccus sp.]|uniref:DNA-processing protein DprA n=1 Tax=Fluviicoccus sp. TaxID=2003552 RepID=UPI0027215E78|nr:DNA-processing protein DprA [Fluviicoccus sp.]MDO8330545.1 DNA-processing protein DprA [Fluviicoccus sp.]